MEIISLKIKSKTNPNIFIANANNQEYELHSDIIVKNSIKKGEIDEQIFFDSVLESAKLIAWNLALKYIGNKLKTEKQIKDYLYKKGYHKNVVEDVNKKLVDYGIISDKIYAETYIKLNSKNSKNRLKQKLYSFGVKSNLVDELTLELDDTESCQMEAQKFFKNKQLTKENTDKLIRRLQTKGYSWDTIKSTLNKLKMEIEDDRY